MEVWIRLCRQLGLCIAWLAPLVNDPLSGKAWSRHVSTVTVGLRRHLLTRPSPFLGIVSYPNTKLRRVVYIDDGRKAYRGAYAKSFEQRQIVATNRLELDVGEYSSWANSGGLLERVSFPLRIAITGPKTKEAP